MIYNLAKTIAKLQQKNEMRKFLYIFIGIALVFFTSCESSSTTTVPSSVAKLTGFSFAAVDSMPGLAAAVFTVEEKLDTGLVWNKDSILYGTRLDSVVPRFVFAATPGAAWLTFPDTLVQLTGYDTLDFTKRPIYLSIRSQDNSTVKTYEIRATAHQVDPALYTWEQLTPAIYPADDSEQKVIQLGNEFVMIVSNGFELSAHRSTDGTNWTHIDAINGLPAGTRVRQIISDGTTLYYGQGNAIYTSTDIQNWTVHAVTEEVVTMLLYWNDKVWVLVGQEGDYDLAFYADGGLTMSGLQPAGEFPVSDFAAVTFESASNRKRALIIGGFAENGHALNTRWNIEYSTHIHENGGYRMEEFSIDRPTFKSLTGISVIDYNKQLLLFGGVDDKMTYLGRDILYSENEGMTWHQADSTRNRLPDAYQARQKQNAIVRDNNIYLFGGQDGSTTYSDVYKGRLNSIDWD